MTRKRQEIDLDPAVSAMMSESEELLRQSEESTRKRPRYPSEDKRVARKVTLELDPDTASELRELGAKLGGGKGLSAVAQAMIEYTLEAYQLGRIELRPRVGPDRMRFEVVEAGADD